MGLPMRGRGVLKCLGVEIKRSPKSNGVDRVEGVRVGNVGKNCGLLSNNVAITTGKDSVDVDPRLDFARKFPPICAPHPPNGGKEALCDCSFRLVRSSQFNLTCSSILLVSDSCN